VKLSASPGLPIEARRRRYLRWWGKRIAWHLTVRSAAALKRGLDIAVAVSMLALLSPLFLFVAVCIKLADRGPVLYWQTRVGRFGQTFDFPKFRSMVMGADRRWDEMLVQNDHDSSVTFKMKDDPRITRIGRFIRKLSIDEMPQLWCVLRGQMSLVGPRPPLPDEVQLYTLSDRRRLEVIPGLTCIWQVSGRSDIPFDEQVVLDLEYIHSQSIWLDIKLLLRTVPAVVLGRGAY
jgi:lipopolysaccharide/colanic/teichoic acid biosynthesis glycosyltransferase